MTVLRLKATAETRKVLSNKMAKQPVRDVEWSTLGPRKLLINGLEPRL